MFLEKNPKKRINGFFVFSPFSIPEKTTEVVVRSIAEISQPSPQIPPFTSPVEAGKVRTIPFEASLQDKPAEEGVYGEYIYIHDT